MDVPRRWFAIGTALAVAGSGVVAALHAGTTDAAAPRDASRQTHRSHVRFIGSRTTLAEGVSVAGVTPYQLSQLHVQLLTATSTPTTTASEADAVAQEIYSSDPVGQTVQTNCVMLGQSAQPELPCWVVVLQPPVGVVAGGESPGVAANPPTVEMALIDSDTGALIEGYQSDVPAAASGG